jgi:hypothetical protein
VKSSSICSAAPSTRVDVVPQAFELVRPQVAEHAPTEQGASRWIVGSTDGVLEPAMAFADVAPREPVGPQCAHESELQLGLALLPRPLDGLAEIGIVRSQSLEQRRLVARAREQVDLLRECKEELRFASQQLRRVGPFCEPLPRVLADRLEHPVASVRRTDEVLVDQGLERVEVGVGDLLGRFERAAPGEGRESREQLLLLPCEEVVRPGDRRAERLLAGVGVAAASEQVEALRQPLEDLRRREDTRARCRQFDRQRQVVEANTELGDSRVGIDLRAGTEELDGFRRCQRRHRIVPFPLDTQQLTARGE